MLNINFVPDDYIQNNASRRTNFTYLVLFLALMAILVGFFATIKMRQRAFNSKEKLVNAKMAQAQEIIKEFEELQTKRKVMMKTALTTAELIEPVPKSIVLASITNNLPRGVSLLRINLVQKELTANRAAANNKYAAAKAEKAAADQTKAEKLPETLIDIEGVAPSDIQVAAYIKQLSSSTLLDNVALVESKEFMEKDLALRQFKLTALIRKDVRLNREEVAKIAVRPDRGAFN